MFVEIILNKTSKELNRVFDYIVPNKLEKLIKLGDRVFVTFGKSNKTTDGIVINIKEKSEFANKEIIEIANSYLTKENVEFAKLMAKRYFCNDFECIKLMLPPGTLSKEVESWVKEKTEDYIYLNKNIDEIKEELVNKKIKSIKHEEVLKYLIENNSNPVLLKKVEEDINVSKNILKTIEKHGYIEIKKEIVKRELYENKEIEKTEDNILNDEQQYAYFRVSENIKKGIFEEFLLYGVTGSR